MKMGLNVSANVIDTCQSAKSAQIYMGRNFGKWAILYLSKGHSATRFKPLFNPYPSKPWLLGVCGSSLLKALWKKEKLLVTSNFSFSHGVFYHFGVLSYIFVRLKLSSAKKWIFTEKYLNDNLLGKVNH